MFPGYLSPHLDWYARRQVLAFLGTEPAVFPFFVYIVPVMPLIVSMFLNIMVV